jgi:hypothetical protein
MKTKCIQQIATLMLAGGILAGATTTGLGSITWDLGEVYSGTPPPDPKPWLEITVSQAGANQVQLTIQSFLNTAESGSFIGGVGLNFGGTLAELQGLSFTGPSKTGTFDDPAVGHGGYYKFDGGGYYDIAIDFAENQPARFDYSDSVSYLIHGTGITPNSFNYLSTQSGGNGTWPVVAFIQGYGGSAFTSTLAAPVPEPTTVIAGALLLLPFGASTLRMLRKNRG